MTLKHTVCRSQRDVGLNSGELVLGHLRHLFWLMLPLAFMLALLGPALTKRHMSRHSDLNNFNQRIIII